MQAPVIFLKVLINFIQKNDTFDFDTIIDYVNNRLPFYYCPQKYQLDEAGEPVFLYSTLLKGALLL